jgi:hypothetical protein
MSELERRAGFEPASTGFADLRVSRFAIGALKSQPFRSAKRSRLSGWSVVLDIVYGMRIQPQRVNAQHRQPQRYAVVRLLNSQTELSTTRV